MRALSIQQPWAWLIVNGYKPVENRTWTHPHRGRTLIHAGKQLDRDADGCLLQGIHPATGGEIDRAIVDAYIAARSAGTVYLGGIVGEAEVAGWFDHRDERAKDPWFVGPIGYEIRNAAPKPFFAMPGKLGFFHVEPGAILHV